MSSFLTKFFSPNDREVTKARKIVEKINVFEAEVEKLSNKELQNSTNYFRKKLAINIESRRSAEIYYNVEYPTLDKKKLELERKALLELLPEVYARVREAAKRVAKHRHFDVQLITGILLAQGKITEVFTGEGKTNSSILPTYLYSLLGYGVHVATVNDYLAKRDAEWGGQVLMALGAKTTVITGEGSYEIISDEEVINFYGPDSKATLEKKDMANMSTMNGTNLKKITKKEAYLSDIIYGQASEFGFDYLRDNSAKTLEDRVQRHFVFAVVDECDSILIDEARTPLIISEPDSQPSEIYTRFATIAGELIPEEDYVIDEKRHSVVLSDMGIKKVEEMFGKEDVWSDSLFIRHMDNALKARALYRIDKEYIVHNDEVLIVDQFTGRVQPGRRFSEGLHQALEAKERVPIKQESKTLATISYQNYFRTYSYLSGMTGTAMTEAEEFQKIYKLDVIRVPTYKKVIRDDMADVIYKSEKGKFAAVVEEIRKLYELGRPVLAGTTSIEKSEYLSNLLKNEGIPHQVLNAKLHEKEAKVIANAGAKNTITIATNMAGRGTDIKLSDFVKELGGLHIIGTERHDARRIDNQLRGRSGRLGDPGSSKFYLSLEDHLMRVFGGDMMKAILSNALPEDTPLESRMLSNVLEKAQQKVESLNFDTRRRLVDYDDVLNQQREIVYKLRKLILIQLHNEQFPKLDRMKLKEPQILKFIESLRKFTLKKPNDSEIRSFTQNTFMDYSLRIWILKQIVTQIESTLGELNKIAVSIPPKQATLLFDYLDTCISDTLQEEAARSLGFENYALFKDTLITVKKKSAILHTDSLVNLLIECTYLELKSLSTNLPDKEYERFLIMSSLDYLWMDHIDAMADLREGIGLRGYAQRDPLVEYKREGAILFEEFFASLGDMIARKMYRLRMNDTQNEIPPEMSTSRVPIPRQGRAAVHKAVTDVLNNRITKQNDLESAKSGLRAGRNDPCPCGSGKKYKKCHMLLDMKTV
ncbi:SEC-C domain-containing protein [bacterium]|nr:SEC-C domain-containing protein [bacterium]